MDILSLFGNLSSIIGLGITVAVFFGVRKISDKIVFKATMSDIIEELEKHSGQLRIMMRLEYFKEKNRDEEIKDCHYSIEKYLNHLAKISDSEIKKDLKNICNSFVKARKENLILSNDFQWETCRRLQGIINSLKTHKKEQPWRINA